MLDMICDIQPPVGGPSGNIEGWGAEVGTLSILEETATNLVAPYKVWLEAVCDFAGADLDHDVEYIWDLGDAAPDFTAPVNSINGKSSRYMYGRVTCAVQPAAGSWTIRCTAIDKRAGATNGNWQTTTISRVVQTKADFFGPSQSIVIAADSDYIGAPAHDEANNRFTNPAAAVSRANALGGHGIIYFKRGESYDERIIPGSGPASWMLADWGSGAKPRLIWDDVSTNNTLILASGFGFGNGASPIPFVMENIAFDGGWTAPAANPGALFGIAIDQQHTRFLAASCDFEGLAIVFNAGTAQNGYGCFYNCVAEKNFGGLHTGGFVDGHAVIGCRVAADPNDWATDATNGGGWLCRSKGVGFATIHAWGDYFGFKGSPSGGRSILQDVIRMGGDAESGHHMYAFGNVCEGGGLNAYTDDNTNIPSKKVAGFMSYNYLMAASHKRTFIEAAHSGMTIENNIFAYPASDDAYVNPDYLLSAAINIRPSGSDASISSDAKNGLWRVNNNTIVVLDEDGPLTQAGLVYEGVSVEVPIENGVPVFTNVQVYDNLLHAPYQSSPVTTYAPIDLTKRTNVAHRYLGYKDEDEALIAGTETPSQVVVVSSVSGTFTEDSPVTDSLAATAKLLRYTDLGGGTARMWLDGPVAAGSITQGGASATAGSASVYGGPAVVGAPLAGSSAIDAGSIPSGQTQPALTFGTPAARGATYSIGALED